VANTFRFTEEEKVIYYAVLSTRQRTYFSKIFSAGATIDKAGSGDCFMGGLIFSLINNFDLQDSVHFAAAAAFGKLQVRGDNTSQTVEQIKFSLQ
jgi:2-dehydro-3-deoxygluconokinase